MAMPDVELPPGVDTPAEERRGQLRRSEDRRRRLSTVQALVWALIGAVVVLYLFFVALNAINPSDAPAASIVVAVLALLWLAHSWRRLWAGGISNKPDRERRGF
jgi:membrane protein YdbS with pleckstrin-like domain